MAKIIYEGLEDGGKTYMLARHADELLKRNTKWLKQTGVPRRIAINTPLSEEFEQRHEDALGVPVRYWRDVAELVEMTDCDLIIDEIGTYFDARTYSDLPLEVRLWLAQASKLGVDIYGSCQSFAQVDIAFRRLTTTLFRCRKILGSRRPSPSKPGSSKIWGLGLLREYDPQSYNADSGAFQPHFGFSFYIFRKKYTKLFDTNKRVALSAYPPFRHIERKCSRPGCPFHRVDHR